MEADRAYTKDGDNALPKLKSESQTKWKFGEIHGERTYKR